MRGGTVKLWRSACDVECKRAKGWLNTRVATTVASLSRQVIVVMVPAIVWLAFSAAACLARLGPRVNSSLNTGLLLETFRQGLLTESPVLVWRAMAETVEVDGEVQPRRAAAERVLLQYRRLRDSVQADGDSEALFVRVFDAKTAMRDGPPRPGVAGTGPLSVASPSDSTGAAEAEEWLSVIAATVTLSTEGSQDQGSPSISAVTIRAVGLKSRGLRRLDSLTILQSVSADAGDQDVSSKNVATVRGGKDIQGISGATFIHRPANPSSPTIQRITRSLCQSEFNGKSVFSWRGAGATAQSHTGLGPGERGVMYIADRFWDRIVYGKLEGQNSWIKSFGHNEPVPGHNLRNITAMTANNGWGPAGTVAYAFVCDHRRRPRVNRLVYTFSSRTLSYDDSLSTPADGISSPRDIAINNAGTRDDPTDDWLWVCDAPRGQLLKYNCFGTQGATMRYGGGPGGHTEITTPIAAACGRSVYGDHDWDVFVVDASQSKLKRFVDYGDTLLLEGEVPLDSYNGDLTGALVVDSWGNILVGMSAPDEGQSKILKFLPSLEFLDVFAPGPDGDAGIFRLVDLSNPLGAGSLAGYGDLFVTEAWDDNSGGQWFYLGVEMTSGAVSDIGQQAEWLRLSYTATDGHLVDFRILRYDPPPVDQWVELAPPYPDWIVRPPGFNQGDLVLSDGGVGCNYKVEMYYRSAYENWLGQPVNSGLIEFYHSKCACACACAGDVNGDGVVNVTDVLWLMDYVISSGAPLGQLIGCPQNGDWDCDGQIGILDVVACADLAFQRGPLPCNMCDCYPYPANCPEWPAEAPQVWLCQ